MNQSVVQLLNRELIIFFLFNHESKILNIKKKKLKNKGRTVLGWFNRCMLHFILIMGKIPDTLHISSSLRLVNKF